jgi:hypothetical protein
MIVIDASAVLEALLRTPAAGAVERRLFEPAQTLHAPHLLDVEVRCGTISPLMTRCMSPSPKRSTLR